MAFERIDDHLEFDPACHAFRLDGRPVPSVTQCLKMADLINTQWFTDYSRERGSAVHLACHYLDENDLSPDYLDSEQAGYLDAWDLFCRHHNVRWAAIEKPVYSEMLQLVGIPDRVGLIDDQEGVCEIKTGELYPVTGVQLALQARLIKPEVVLRRVAVRLYPDGHYAFTEYKNRDDYKVGLAAVTITHFKRKYQKG